MDERGSRYAQSTEPHQGSAQHDGDDHQIEKQWS